MPSLSRASAPLLLASTLLLASFGSPSSAHARLGGHSDLEPVPGARLVAAFVMGGYLNADKGAFRGAVNPQQYGLQWDLGNTFEGGFHLAFTTRVFLGQKFDGDLLTSQQFGITLGYSRPMRVEVVAIRPVAELGVQRYHFEIGPNNDTDFGFYAAFGGDVVADVLPHFFLKSMARLGFAAMGRSDGNLSVSGGGTDVYVQVGVSMGLRF